MGPLDEIMCRIHRGDERGLCDLMTHHRHQLESLAGQILGDMTAAEDVVQETFIAIWQRRQTFSPGKDAWPWVAKIVRNMCYQRWRSRHGRRKGRNPSEVPIEWAAYVHARPSPPSTRAKESELFDAASELIGRLSPTLREVAQLSILGSKTDAEIAETLGVPIGTVKSRKHRGIAVLRRGLRPHTGQET